MIVLAEHANFPGLDVLRVLKMLIVHDLVEIDAGDTFAYDTARMVDQHEREARAADRIFGLLPADKRPAPPVPAGALLVRSTDELPPNLRTFRRESAPAPQVQVAELPPPAIAFNPQQQADIIRKQGGFIPGIRPGPPTERYLAKVLNRITLPGSLFLATIAIIPLLACHVVGTRIAGAFFSVIYTHGYVLLHLGELQPLLGLRQVVRASPRYARFETEGGATFSIATSRQWSSASGEKQEKTEWHKCVAWNVGTRGTGLADVVEKYVKKGDKLYVEGRIEYRQYEDKDKQTRYVTEINVREILLLGGGKAGGGDYDGPPARRATGGSPAKSAPASRRSPWRCRCAWRRPASTPPSSRRK